MHKRLTTYLLVVLSLLFISVMPSAANNTYPSEAPAISTCPAPAPTGLNAVSVTPTTITLAWFATMGNYYKIDVFDLTLGFGLAPTYPSGSPATVTNLTPGHDYQINISASYCIDGPYGNPSESLYVSTPSIIIDMIVEFQSPCSLPTPKAVSSGSSAEICVPDTDQTGPHEFGSGVIGKAVYLNRTVFFGMAWEENSLQFTIGKLGNQGYISSPNFEFEGPKDPVSGNPIIPPPYAICMYNGTPLFKVGMNMQSNNTNVVNADITFLENVSFAYCGEDCGNARPGADGDAALAKYDPSEADDREFAQDLLNSPAPNPFRESATFRYALAAPLPVEIGLYNALGGLVQKVQQAELLSEGEHTAFVSGAGLTNGVYFLRVQTGNQYKTFALVKQE